MELEIENKAIDPETYADVSVAFDDLMSSFESYKDTNDQRLDELSKKKVADVITEDKLARIDEALDQQQRVLEDLAQKQSERTGTSQNALTLEHQGAFDTYLRKGHLDKLTDLEEKAMSVGSEADGGYLVPDELEQRIMRALEEDSPMRSIASTITISSSVFRRPFALGGAEGGWVGETEGRPQTATPTLTELAFPTMELYAMPAATLRLLDDAAVDIDAWLAEEIRSVFAAQEGRAFVHGDGINQPKGLLSYPAAPEASWSWGNIGYVATGDDGAFAADDPADALIDLVFSLKTGYRRKARFVMNRLTQSAARKLKDGDGNYLWQPSLGGPMVPTLLGYPITECEDMPDIASDSLSIAFGDFSRGYLVVDRAGIHALRDPFTSKPYVLFYSTKRVGGGVQDFDAIKLMKFGVS